MSVSGYRREKKATWLYRGVILILISWVLKDLGSIGIAVKDFYVRTNEDHRTVVAHTAQIEEQKNTTIRYHDEYIVDKKNELVEINHIKDDYIFPLLQWQNSKRTEQKN